MRSDSLPERKPHPLPLIEAMKAAARAGVHGIGCSYGYCAAEKLIDAGASIIIQSPYELPGALLHVATLAPRTAIA